MDSDRKVAYSTVSLLTLLTSQVSLSMVLISMDKLAGGSIGSRVSALHKYYWLRALLTSGTSPVSAFPLLRLWRRARTSSRP